MKKIKSFIITLIVVFVFPLFVEAGTISFQDPVKTSNNTYEFSLVVDNIDLNYIDGNIGITNGKISKVTMSNGWINKTGNNSEFYYYHNGISSGNYKVATIEVTMTGNSVYNILDLKYGKHTCTKDKYGNIFGENGKLVSLSEYNNTCGLSTDASLKSLSTNIGTLSPSFNSSTLRYNITVENNVKSVTFYPVTNNSKAKIITNTTFDLKEGINICNITVQAERGNTTNYVVAVFRKSTGMPNYEANISNFQVHNGKLTTSFNQYVYEYHVKPDEKAKQIYFTFDTNNGANSHTSEACSVNSDYCKLTVLFADGKTRNTYTFYIDNNAITTPPSTSEIKNPENNPTSTSDKKTNNKTTTNNKTNNKITNTNNNTNNSLTTQEENKTEEKVEEQVIIDPTKENSKKEETNKNKDINKIDEIIEEEKENNKITIPFINIEVSEVTFITISAILLFILGIILGTLICKRKRK